MKKKINILICSLSAIGVFLIITNSCKNENLAVLRTHAVYIWTQTSVIGCGGTIINDGNSDIVERGVCWNLATGPTILHNRTSNGTGIGYFSSDLTGLTPNTEYFYRAYATNGVGTAYGNELSFTTMPILAPYLHTIPISSITSSTATSGGEIVNDSGAAVTARGVCWSSSGLPTIKDDITTDGTGTGTFTSNLTGLAAGTTYYVRAYATNSVGTAYGEELSFYTDKW